MLATDAGVPAPIDAQVDAAPAPTFYSALDALADVESGPLKHIGTGAWPGNYSIKACAYRNERVLVVDGYCTHKEQPAFRLVVLSPTRGRVDIYAEADKPISGLKRADYQTFYVDTEPAITDATLPAISLALTYAQLTDWEQKNYDHRIRGGQVCSTGIASCADPAWLEPAKAFVADPPEAWYRIIHDLRTRAGTDAGKITRQQP